VGRYTDCEVLDRLIERLLTSPKAKGLDTAKGSFDRCKRTSFWVEKEAKKAGLEARVIQLSGGPSDRTKADPRWIDQSTVYHYVPVVEGYSIDLCARQFNPDNHYPDVRVLEDLRSEWDSACPAGLTSLQLLWHPFMDIESERPGL
jgi:hypothetical protein